MLAVHSVLKVQLYDQAFQKQIQFPRIHHQVVSNKDEVQMLAERWLSKENIRPSLGRVCSGMVDSSTQPKISALTFHSTQTA